MWRELRNGHTVLRAGPPRLSAPNAAVRSGALTGEVWSGFCFSSERTGASNVTRGFAPSHPYSLCGPKPCRDRGFNVGTQQVVSTKKETCPAAPRLKICDLPVTARRKHRHAGIPLHNLRHICLDSIKLLEILN